MISKPILILLAIGILTIVVCLIIKKGKTPTEKEVIENFENIDSTELVRNQFVSKLLNLIENFSTDLNKLKHTVETFSTYPDLDQIESSTIDLQLKESNERVAKNKRNAMNNEHTIDEEVIEEYNDNHKDGTSDDDNNDDANSDDDNNDDASDEDHNDDANSDEDHNDDDQYDDDNNDDDHSDDDHNDDDDLISKELKNHKNEIMKHTVEKFTNNVGKPPVRTRKNEQNIIKNKRMKKKNRHSMGNHNHDHDNEHFVEGLTCGSTANCFHY